MTCIVGMKVPGGVLMAGDSAGCAGTSIWTSTQPKVFHLGELIIGYTTSFRLGQVIEHCLSLPELPVQAEDAHAMMVKRVVPAVRQAFIDAGITKVENGVEEAGQFLVGFRERLFEVGTDFCVFEAADRFAAVGCGAELARGSLCASEELEDPPEEAMFRALRAAARFSSGVRAPFHIVSSVKEEIES
jgi:ATP-dependent protease HslVU (ClpYQ) peptidase subunit